MLASTLTPLRHFCYAVNMPFVEWASFVPHSIFEQFWILLRIFEYFSVIAVRARMHSKYEVFGPQVCDGEHTMGLHAFWSRKNTQNTIKTWRQKPNYLIHTLLFTMCLRHHLHVGFSCLELTWNLEALVSLFTADSLSYTVLVKCLRLCVSARVSAFPWACWRARKTLCNSGMWNLSGRCTTLCIGAYDWVPNLVQGPWAEPVQASPWTPWHGRQVLELVKPGCRCQETQRKLSLMPLEESLLPQFSSRYLTACSLLHLLVLDPKFWTICMRFIRE